MYTQHKEFCIENGLPELKHVLYPRFPAFVQATTVLGTNDYKFIYDITLLYYKMDESTGEKNFIMSPGILDFIFGSLSKTVWYIDIHVERHSLAAINLERINLEKWLEKVWLTKETIIENYVGPQIINSEKIGKKERIKRKLQSLKKN